MEITSTERTSVDPIATKTSQSVFHAQNPIFFSFLFFHRHPTEAARREGTLKNRSSHLQQQTMYSPLQLRGQDGNLLEQSLHNQQSALQLMPLQYDPTQQFYAPQLYSHQQEYSYTYTPSYHAPSYSPQHQHLTPPHPSQSRTQHTARAKKNKNPSMPTPTMNKTRVSISFKNIAAIRERKPAPAPPPSTVLSMPPQMGQHGMINGPSPEEQRKMMLKMKLKQRIADKEHGTAIVGTSSVASIPLDDGGYRTCGTIVSPVETTQSLVTSTTDLVQNCMQIDCQEPVQLLAPPETPSNATPIVKPATVKRDRSKRHRTSTDLPVDIQQATTPAMGVLQIPQLHENQELEGQPLEGPERKSPPMPALSTPQYEHMHPFFTPFSAGGFQMLFMPVHMPSPSSCLLSPVSDMSATPGSNQTSNTPTTKMHPHAFGDGAASRMASLGSLFHPTLQSQLSMGTLIDSLNFDKNAQGETKGPSPVMGILVPVGSTGGASNEIGDSSAATTSSSASQAATNTGAHMPISVVFSPAMYRTFLEQRNIMTGLQETNESAAEPPLLEKRESLSWMLDMALPMSGDAETSAVDTDKPAKKTRKRNSSKGKEPIVEHATSAPKQEVQQQQQLFIQIPGHHIQQMYNFKSQETPTAPAPQQESTPASSASSSTFTTAPPVLGIAASPDMFKSLSPTSPFPLQRGFSLYLQTGEDNSMMVGGVFAPFKSAPGVMLTGDDSGGMGHIWVPVSQVQGAAGSPQLFGFNI